MCGNKFSSSSVAQSLLLLILDILQAEGKVCVKREEIGNREGNLYDCNDPVLTECCETNRTFTCCEPPWKNALINQLWVLFGLLVVGFILCIIVSWCTGQSEFFGSATAKDAAKNWKDKFAHGFDSIRGRGNRTVVSTSTYASLDQASSVQSLDHKPQLA